MGYFWEGAGSGPWAACLGGHSQLEDKSPREVEGQGELSGSGYLSTKPHGPREGGHPHFTRLRDVNYDQGF